MTPLEKRAEEQTQNYTDSVQVIETDEIGNAVFRFKDIDQAFTSGFTSFKDQPEVKGLLDALRISKEKHIGMAMCLQQHGTNLNVPFLIDDCLNDAKRDEEALKAWGEFTGESNG